MCAAICFKKNTLQKLLGSLGVLVYRVTFGCKSSEAQGLRIKLSLPSLRSTTEYLGQGATLGRSFTLEASVSALTR